MVESGWVHVHILAFIIFIGKMFTIQLPHGNVVRMKVPALMLETELHL